MMRHPVTQISNGSTNKDGIAAIKDVLLVPRLMTSMALDHIGIGPIPLECLEEDASDEPQSPSAPSQGGDIQSSFQVAPDEEATAGNEIFDEASRSEASRLPTPRSSGERPPRDHARGYHCDSDPDTGIVVTPESWTNTSRQSMSSATTSTESTSLPLRPSGLRLSQDDEFVSPDATRNVAYVALLDKVIQAARWTMIPRIEAYGTYQPQSLGGWNEVDLSAAVGDGNSLERNRKVGAAGELFVSLHSYFVSSHTDSSSSGVRNLVTYDVYGPTTA